MGSATFSPPHGQPHACSSHLLPHGLLNPSDRGGPGLQPAWGSPPGQGEADGARNRGMSNGKPGRLGCPESRGSVPTPEAEEPSVPGLLAQSLCLRPRPLLPSTAWPSWGLRLPEPPAPSHACGHLQTIPTLGFRSLSSPRKKPPALGWALAAASPSLLPPWVVRLMRTVGRQPFVPPRAPRLTGVWMGRGRSSLVSSRTPRQWRVLCGCVPRSAGDTDASEGSRRAAWWLCIRSRAGSPGSCPFHVPGPKHVVARFASSMETKGR